ncbi:MAG: hypothetical protein WDN76_05860 [Alphaproteobacteria bacterium]
MMLRVEDDEPFDIAFSWADLQHAIAMMLAALGGCALAVAERLILTRKARIEILQWLAPIEAVARRLLLLEALKLPPPNEPPPFMPRGKLASAYADKPEAELSGDAGQWRVRFNIGIASAPPKTASGGAMQALRSHPIQFNAIALARRIEAVRRLFDQREMYARRLALRVHRAPARARKAFAPYRHRATAVQTLLRETQQQVDLAFDRLNTS